MDTVGIDDVIAEVGDWATGEGVDQLVTCQAGRRCSYVSRLLGRPGNSIVFFFSRLPFSILFLMRLFVPFLKMCFVFFMWEDEFYIICLINYLRDKVCVQRLLLTVRDEHDSQSGISRFDD